MDFPPRFYNEFHRFFDGQAKWSESFHKVRCRANRNGNSHRIGANSSRDRRAKIDRAFAVTEGATALRGANPAGLPASDPLRSLRKDQKGYRIRRGQRDPVLSGCFR